MQRERLAPPEHTIENEGVARVYQRSSGGVELINVEIVDYDAAVEARRDEIETWLEEYDWAAKDHREG